MGRSVNYLSRADAVAYIAFDEMYRLDECYDCEGSGAAYRSSGFIGPLPACPTCEGTGEPDDMAVGPEEHDWDNFMEDLTDRLMVRYPSLYDANKWSEREVQTFAQNDHAIFAVSEYCGLVSVSVRAKQGYEEIEPENEGLAARWTKSIVPGFHRFIHQVYGEYALSRMGGFSDGTSVYQRAA